MTLPTAETEERAQAAQNQRHTAPQGAAPCRTAPCDVPDALRLLLLVCRIKDAGMHACITRA